MKCDVLGSNASKGCRILYHNMFPIVLSKGKGD